MTNSIQPGSTGTPLPGGIIVLRLATPSKDFLESQKPSESTFALSTDDKESELKALSVQAEDLTTAENARELMGEKRAAYRLILHLNVDDIRAIRISKDFPVTPLEVVWDTDSRPGAEGHAGLVGLFRPSSGERKLYKALRAKLTQSVTKIELLPEIPPQDVGLLPWLRRKFSRMGRLAEPDDAPALTLQRCQLPAGQALPTV